MSKRIFTTLMMCFIAIAISTSAQNVTSNEQILEKAVKIYNDIPTAVSNFQKSGNFKDSERIRIESRILEAESALDQISNPDNEEMANVVRYFRANLQFENAYLYGIIGNYSKMETYLKQVKTFFDQAEPGFFPLNYKYDGKNYTIKYENFEYTRGEFYSSIAEAETKLKNYDNVPEYSRKGLTIITDSYVRVLVLDFLLVAKSNLKQYDSEMAENAINYMDEYLKLDSKNKNFLDSFNYSYKRGWDFLVQAYDRNPSLGYASSNYAKAATILVKANDRQLAARAYEQALNAGNTDKSFLFEVARAGEFASSGLKSRACNLLSGISLTCYEMTSLSGIYSDLGNYDKSQEFEKKARKCASKEAHEAKVGSGSGFHFYLGTYPFRFIGHKDYIDYGGVAGFSAGKVMVLGSYMIVNKNLYAWTDMSMKSINDNSSEQYYWSGDQMNVSIRFSPERFRKGDVASYFGPQFGISNRKLSPIHTDVTNNLTGITVPGMYLEPTDKQYQAALNFGSFVGGKGVGLDFNISVGASYCQFSMNNPDYNLNDFTYSNGYLDNREEWHWGIVLRAGVTVGLFL